MPSAKGKQSRVVALEASSRAAQSTSVEVSPLYGVAMLKLAMELKKSDALSVDELITSVLGRMRLDEADFRRFLETNGGLLRTIAQKRSP
jgi:hypothetical protein